MTIAACISCGECEAACTFRAIGQREGRFVIDQAKCDACGDCSLVCPAAAVEIVAG